MSAITAVGLAFCWDIEISIASVILNQKDMFRAHKAASESSSA